MAKRSEIPLGLPGQGHKRSSAGSSPFKGEARRGMGLTKWCFEASAALREPHPHPSPPLEGEGAALLRGASRGFTLIELLVVMAIIAMLLALASPRYFSSVDKSKETMLRQTLSITREALDKYYGDNGRYPDNLEALVSKKYLRNLPFDPVAGNNNSWIVVAPESVDQGGVLDLKSGAAGNGHDGSAYKDW